jgi:hypothetical protein
MMRHLASSSENVLRYAASTVVDYDGHTHLLDAISGAQAMVLAS